VRKVVVRRPGSYERLVLEDHPDPEPGPGEVLVESAAIGVNYADCIVRMGLYASAKKYVGWPITPGFEFAGRVVAARPAASDRSDVFVPGESVFGVTRFGAYASHIAVPSAQLFRVPTRLNLVEAAAFPTVFLTAWYALCELVRLRPKMTVLVHSAAGGVGGALLQVARASGCTPIAVVGAPHKVEVARALGAHAVIDKSREALWPAARRLVPEGYDVVLDANGPSTLKQSYEQLKPTGKLIVYGFHSMIPQRGGRPNWPKLALDYLRTPRFGPFALTNDNKSVLAFNLSYLFERMDLLREGMQGLLDWVMAGKLSAPPVRELPLDRVGDAHRELESGMTVGKFVLIP
jgi:NADPH:quinone reductase-like Zn-dependent oxidoreductase